MSRALGPELLRTWLAAEGLTQAVLGKRLGVTSCAVTHWCVGRNPPVKKRRAQLERITKGKVPAISWWNG